MREKYLWLADNDLFCNLIYGLLQHRAGSKYSNDMNAIEEYEGGNRLFELGQRQ